MRKTYVFCNNSVPFTCYTDCILDLDNDLIYYRLRLVCYWQKKWSSKFLTGGCYTCVLSTLIHKFKEFTLCYCALLNWNYIPSSMLKTKLPSDPVSALLSTQTTLYLTLPCLCHCLPDQNSTSARPEIQPYIIYMLITNGSLLIDHDKNTLV